MKIAGTSLDPLFFWKRDHNVSDALELASSTAATLARLGSGGMVAHLGARPERRLELFEMEGCPYSRKVREALSILDLDAIVHPCPTGGTRFRARLESLIGKVQVPVLVDPNADVVIADSDEAVRHLFASYGDGKVSLPLRGGKITDVSSRLASRLRGDRGTTASPSYAPEDLLELYSYEASPYCRIVRETLSRFEIPYVLHNVARGSAKRDAFVALSGKMQVPFLVDRSLHRAGIFETKEIVRHLEEQYGKPTHHIEDVAAA